MKRKNYKGFGSLKISVIIFMSVFLLLSIKLQSQQCVDCNSSNTTNGSYASAIGTNNHADGDFSFVAGENSRADGRSSFSFGQSSKVYDNYALGIGRYLDAYGSSSLAIGRFLRTLTPDAMVIGYGYSETQTLDNNINRSLMIGLESTKPTFFVGPSSGVNNTGRIGIGDITAPEAKLHIRADAGEDADILLEPTGENQTAQIRLGQNNSISAQDGGDMRFETETGQAFVFENGNIGIGNSQPQAKLHISGDMQVGEVSQPHNVRIFGGINGSGDYASSFGDGNTASGNYSFVAGRNSVANQSNAIVIGSDSRASGGHSYVVGSTSFALGNFSYSFGGNSTSESDFSLVLGHNLISRNGAFVIGKGNVDAKLTNNNQESLMVGFNSAFPTMFVSRTELGFQSGRVGIGNVTSPQAKLHIKADAGEPATLRLEATGTSGDNIYSRMLFTPNHSIQAANNQNFTFSTQSSKHFVFQNGNVGIGSSEPLAKLHVADGDVYIEDINHGIIMKSPNGQCWRGTLTDQGLLNFVQATCPDFTSTGSELLKQNSHMLVFPNPASNSITVETSLKGQQGMLLLVSPDGTQLSRQKISADKTTLNMAWLVTGTYLIQLEINGQVVESAKVVKQ
jgi:hypothetical protein